MAMTKLAGHCQPSPDRQNMATTQSHEGHTHTDKHIHTISRWHCYSSVCSGASSFRPEQKYVLFPSCLRISQGAIFIPPLPSRMPWTKWTEEQKFHKEFHVDLAHFHKTFLFLLLLIEENNTSQESREEEKEEGGGPSQPYDRQAHTLPSTLRNNK